MSVNTEVLEKEVIVEPKGSLPLSASWHSKVYHPAEEFKLEPEWKAIERVVKARDKHSCQSCGIKIGLGVHHIFPRDKGGRDYPPNLITLCNFCHNEIEEQGFTVKEQIIDYKRKRKYIKQDHNIVTNDKAIRWQQWVYGGYRKP